MRVQCPSCSKLLNVPDSRAGQVVTCPACRAQMQLPALEAGPEPAAPPPPADAGPAAPAPAETKTCPHCGETILKVATKCRHCKSLLIGAGAGPRGPATRFRDRRRGRGSGEGNTALIMGIVSIFFCGLILGPLAIIYGNSARKNPAEAGPAIAGMVLGCIALLLNVLAFGIILLSSAAGVR